MLFLFLFSLSFLFTIHDKTPESVSFIPMYQAWFELLVSLQRLGKGYISMWWGEVVVNWIHLTTVNTKLTTVSGRVTWTGLCHLIIYFCHGQGQGCGKTENRRPEQIPTFLSFLSSSLLFPLEPPLISLHLLLLICQPSFILTIQ